MTLALLSVRWLSFKNGLFRASKRDRRRARSGLFASIVVLCGLGVMAYTVAEPVVAISRSEPALQEMLRRIPSVAFFTAFWMLLLSAVTVGIQTFYLNQELPLLLASPANPRAVFTAKFVEATVTNGALFVMIGSPMLLAFALARGELSPLYALYLVLVMLAFSALPTAIGILLAFMLMRVLPPTRTRDLLAALGMALFAALYFAINLSVRRVSDEQYAHQDINQFAGITSSEAFRRGPWAWAGDVLGSYLSPLAACERIGMLVGVAIAAMWAASTAAHWVHWRGWVTAQEVGESGGRVRRTGRNWEVAVSGLSGPVRAVLLKDLRHLRRDMRQLSMLLIPVAVVAVFLLNMAQNARIANVPAVLLMQTLFLVLGPISLRIAMSAYITESRAMWLMMSAPNDPVTILKGKFLYAYCLSVPLATVATVAYGLLTFMSPFEISMSVCLMLCAMAGFNGIGIGIGAMFADFSADNIRFVISGVGRMVIFGAQMIYLVLFSAVTIAAWILVETVGLPAGVVYSAASLLVPMFTVFAVVGPMALGARRLRKMEW